MKRRSKSGDETSKSSPPKAAAARGRNAPKAGRNRGASIAGQETVVARVTQERDEALLRETANAEILRLISKSPGDLELVFRTILENATRICNANFGTLFRFDGKNFHPVAQFNTPKALLEGQARRGPFQPSPGTAIEHVMRTKQVSHSADKATDPVPGFFAEIGGARSQVAVPMLKDDSLIGVIVIYRQEVRPFTDKQIELVKNFAAQAVIAIENARLLSELRESLEQQTSTSEVLRVISSSPGELDPVFTAMLASAIRICDARFGLLLRYDGKNFALAADVGAPAAYRDHLRERGSFPAIPDSMLDRMIRSRQLTHTADVASELVQVPAAELGGARSFIAVPMLKEDVLAGAIIIYRQEVRPFADKQIELVKNFAAQAVIAIENARLLNELRESLDQQTATSEVLRVISSSPGDLEPVFEAMLQNSVRICEAGFGQMFLCQGDNVRHVATIGVPTTLVEFDKRRGTFQPSPGGGLDQAMRTKQVVHIADLTSEHASYPPARLGGARSYIAVPMLREGELVGAIAIYRQEVRPFTDRQIALVTNFAAQAVIAIENTRLLNELRERTAQLEARSHEIAKLNAQLEQRVADQVGEIERMSRLRRFLPPQVADLIVASGGERQLESHRREITALFCDLRGFTGFSESSDPEDVMTLLRQYHAAIGAIIIKYSGTLERYAGDGVMVVFNDPVPVDNPALQAVRMALDMRAALGALIEKWRRLGHELGFGIGIAHGYATLGTIGFEGRFDYAAIGTVSNVASRLCDEAKPGQILISSRVLMAVEEAIAVESVGDFALKGISRPLAAYNVVGVK
jgi:GAF domain-containing protein